VFVLTLAEEICWKDKQLKRFRGAAFAYVVQSISRAPDQVKRARRFAPGMGTACAIQNTFLYCFMISVGHMSHIEHFIIFLYDISRSQANMMGTSAMLAWPSLTH
jgi:hypothetical protein